MLLYPYYDETVGSQGHASCKSRRKPRLSVKKKRGAAARRKLHWPSLLLQDTNYRQVYALSMNINVFFDKRNFKIHLEVPKSMVS